MNPIAANAATVMMSAFERDTELRTVRTRARRTSGLRTRGRRRRDADLT
ncbi:MAG: hypothetical protein ABIQ15_02250 [Nocardioides sp.]